MRPRPPRSTLFPYTTLFRSKHCHALKRYGRLSRATLIRLGHRASIATKSDRKSTRLNSSHSSISYAVFCLKKKKYLEFLGTRRDVQRKGVGSAVIGSMLERCDREGTPAYLEASSPENVPFYRRHGFDVREELQLKGGPPVWAMMREPR